MVLWEITLGTAYFLGLKRTYRLALKIQRRLISPKYPKFRQFAHRRTRSAFDIALKVHRSIQQRDLEVGRNLGNWILRWLDKMKPSAEIRGSRDGNFTPKRNLRKQTTNSPRNKVPGDSQKFSTLRSGDSNRCLFSSAICMDNSMLKAPILRGVEASNIRLKNGSDIQYRRMSFVGSGEFGHSYDFRVAYGGVIRKDIMQWMLRK